MRLEGRYDTPIEPFVISNSGRSINSNLSLIGEPNVLHEALSKA